MLKGLFRGFLRKRLPAPIFDPSFGSPALQTLNAEFRKGDWKGMQESFGSKRDWSMFDDYLEILHSIPKPPYCFDSWIEADPHSYLPWLFRGACLVTWAWEARSARRSTEVSREAWQTFFDRLELAERDLLQAANLAPENPAPWRHLITCATGLNDSQSERKARFHEAQARDKFHFYSHVAMLMGLCKKWGGSHEGMFGFAKTASRHAPDGDSLHAIVARAHVERWLYFSFDQDLMRMDSYFHKPEVKQDIQNAFSRWNVPGMKLSEISRIRDLNDFAFCFRQMRDRDNAYTVFELTKGFVTQMPWAYIDDPESVYRQARLEVQRFDLKFLFG